jgi:hypothetical protein
MLLPLGHAGLFWVCCCPLGFLLPFRKVFKYAYLLQSMLLLLIIILIFKKF